LAKTGVKTVSYVGHSQGTSQMFCGIAENYDFFKERMNLFVALAPVVRVDRCSSGLIRKLKDNENFEKMLIKFE